jgi:hypothetical protein
MPPPKIVICWLLLNVLVTKVGVLGSSVAHARKEPYLVLLRLQSEATRT